MGACNEDKKYDLIDYYTPRMDGELNFEKDLFPNIKCLNDDDMYV